MKIDNGGFDGDTSARSLILFLRTVKSRSVFIADLYRRVRRYQKHGQLSVGALDELIYALVAAPGELLSHGEIKYILDDGISHIRSTTAARLLAKQVAFVDTPELMEDLFGQFFSDRQASLTCILIAAQSLWTRGYVHSKIALRLCQRLQEIPADTALDCSKDTQVFAALSVLHNMHCEVPSNLMSVLTSCLVNGPGYIKPSVYVDMLSLLAMNPGPWEESMSWFKKEAVVAAPSLDSVLCNEDKEKAYYIFAIWATQGHSQSVKLMSQFTGMQEKGQPHKPLGWMPKSNMVPRMHKLQIILISHLNKHGVTLHPACDLLVNGELALIYSDPTIRDLRESDKREHSVVNRMRFKLCRALKFDLRILQGHDFHSSIEDLARHIVDGLKSKHM